MNNHIYLFDILMISSVHITLKKCITFSHRALRTLKWFHSHLNEIKQSVVIGGSKSDLKYMYVQAGVPQGSISVQLIYSVNLVQLNLLRSLNIA